MSKQGRKAQDLTRDIVCALFHLKDEGKPVTLDAVVRSLKTLRPGRLHKPSQIRRLIEADYSLKTAVSQLSVSH